MPETLHPYLPTTGQDDVRFSELPVESRELPSSGLRYLGACYLDWLQGSVAAFWRWLLAMQLAAHSTAEKRLFRMHRSLRTRSI